MLITDRTITGEPDLEIGRHLKVAGCQANMLVDFRCVFPVCTSTLEVNQAHTGLISNARGGGMYGYEHGGRRIGGQMNMCAGNGGRIELKLMQTRSSKFLPFCRQQLLNAGSELQVKGDRQPWPLGSLVCGR